MPSTGFILLERMNDFGVIVRGPTGFYYIIYSDEQDKFYYYCQLQYVCWIRIVKMNVSFNQFILAYHAYQNWIHTLLAHKRDLIPIPISFCAASNFKMMKGKEELIVANHPAKHQILSELMYGVGSRLMFPVT